MPELTQADMLLIEALEAERETALSLEDAFGPFVGEAEQIDLDDRLPDFC